MFLRGGEEKGGGRARRRTCGGGAFASGGVVGLESVPLIILGKERERA